LHALPHDVPSQVGWAFASLGEAHGVQLAPQLLTLVAGTQLLVHGCIPLEHIEHEFAAQY
jgi:hypothetical protein